MRALSPVVPGADADGSASRETKRESAPAQTATAPLRHGTVDTPIAFTDMHGLPSPASTVTPTDGARVGSSVAEVVASDAEPRQQLAAPTQRVPKRPPGTPPSHVNMAAPAPAPATGLLLLELSEPGRVAPPGTTPGRRHIPRPPPLQMGLSLELMGESEEEGSPVALRKSLVQVGIPGATPRSVRVIDQSEDYREISTPKRMGSPFLGGDAFDESEDSDAMSSCSEDSTGACAYSRTLKEHGKPISGSLRPTAPEWGWRLDTDSDQLRRALATVTPAQSLARSSLVEISLSGCSLGPSALAVIASALLEGSAGNLRQHLTILCLADNQLVGADPAAYNSTLDADLSGLRALADALRGPATGAKAPNAAGTAHKGGDGQIAALTSLDLRRNAIGPEGVMILASVWATSSASPVQLQRLQLSDNYITGSVLAFPSLPTATTTMVADAALEGDGDEAMARTHSDLRVDSSTAWVWQLDRSSDGFSCLLAQNQSLADRAGRAGRAARRSFFLGLREGPHLQARLQQQLVSLELRKCYLGPAAANILLEALTSSSPRNASARLDRLDLYHNRIGDKAAAELCKFALAGNARVGTGTASSAPFDTGGIRELLLGFNGLTHACCKPIGAALTMAAEGILTSEHSGNDEEQGDAHAGNTSGSSHDSRRPEKQWALRVLDLTWNTLEPRGVKALCKAISTLRPAATTGGAITLSRVRLSDATEDSFDLCALQRLLDGAGLDEGGFVATKTRRKARASNTASVAIFENDANGDCEDDEDKEAEMTRAVASCEIVLRRRKRVSMNQLGRNPQ